ncbi:D-beta-hydroxybutyrate dehydrogenase, mitochondrial-like, partial [Sceloporus undulatus]|uniref:D-beta-hydroxybutyrate dehydrogenase, mitochondrial-like n=1 Tax=Sceloporus undulatus TaxID=8520 RepID=UPI001C4CF63F
SCWAGTGLPKRAAAKEGSWWHGGGPLAGLHLVEVWLIASRNPHLCARGSSPLGPSESGGEGGLGALGRGWPCLPQTEGSLLLGPAGLWGLVNNAGVASFGNVEFTSLERYQQVAEVNLWGTVRVTKAFLPLIRKARGRVVNVTSMLGRVASPLRSSYCISKFGLEAFTDCLRQEMYPWGVSVVAIEPSNFIAATGILTAHGVEAAAQQMWGEAGESVRADYGGQACFQRQVDQMKAFVHSGLRDISPVLEDITDALSARFPYARYNPMEAHWWVRLQAVTHLPTMLTDWLYVK